MKKSLSYKTIAFTLSIVLLILSASPLFALSEKTITPADVRSVFVGAFTVKVPTDWKSFNENEAADLRRQYLSQSKEIYRQFSGSNDQSKSVDVGAFHISGDAGSFVIVSFTVPPKSDLITLLKNQVKDKMAWGVREGYIRKYLGIVSVDDKQFSGFYTKAIGKTGRIELSGGLEHKKLKNTIIQLTLLCPKDWDEAKATSTLSSVLKSVMLKEKRLISSHDSSADDGQDLIEAAKKGDTARVNALLNKGVDVNAKDNNYGATALMWASENGHTETVRVLLNKGADVNAKDDKGETALMFVHVNGSNYIVEALLKKGADVKNAKYGETALMRASINGHTETVRVLLNKGADVNAKDKDSITALLAASINGHTETVRVLLNKGADVNAKNVQGITALWAASNAASNKGHTEIVQLLKKAGAKE